MASRPIKLEERSIWVLDPRALWQRPAGQTVVLHSDPGTQFTSGEYQRFHSDHNVIGRMR